MNKKRGFCAYIIAVFIVFSLIGFVSAAGTCDESQEIMNLYSSQNTHGGIFSNNVYTYQICYNEIFGKTYTAANPHNCIGTNTVLWLSGTTNAHASAETTTGYTTQVCYGDLTCTVKATCDASKSEQAVVYLSSTTNAHLGTGAFSGLTNNIVCCTSKPIDVNYYCGDGVIKNIANGNPVNEQCERPSTSPPSVAPKETCNSLGFTEGTLGCDENCQLDFSDCAGGCIEGGSCGDSNANCGEQCDGSNLRGLNCAKLGYEGGQLKCTACKLDTSSCTTYTETLLWIDVLTEARGIDTIINGGPAELFYNDASLVDGVAVKFEIYQYNENTRVDDLKKTLSGVGKDKTATAIWTATPIGENYWFKVYKNNIELTGRRSRSLEVISEVSPTSTGCGQFKTETECKSIINLDEFKEEVCTDGMSTSECKAAYSQGGGNQFNLCVDNPNNYRNCKCDWANNKCVFKSQYKPDDGEWGDFCETTLKVKDGALCVDGKQEYEVVSADISCRSQAPVILPCGIEIAELPFFNYIQFIITLIVIMIVYAFILTSRKYE